MRTITFSIENGNKDLYKELEITLAKIEGIERALIDVNDGDLTIEFNDELIDSKKIHAAIENQGANSTEKSTR